jgi:hypothetical protein
MLPVYFALARVAAVVLLLLALREQPHNFYVWLRFVITAVAAWGLYRVFKTAEREWGLVLGGFALLVIFNPFMPMSFKKDTWTIINVISAIGILISLGFIDPQPVEAALTSPLGKAVFRFIGLVVGAGLLVIGLWMIYVAGLDLYKASKLALVGKPAQAKIHHITYGYDREEGGYDEYYIAEYEFYVGGKKAGGVMRVKDNPIESISSENYTETSAGEWALRPGAGTPINILYDESDLEINSGSSRLGVFGREFGNFLVMALFSIFLPLNGARFIFKAIFS